MQALHLKTASLIFHSLLKMDAHGQPVNRSSDVGRLPGHTAK